MRSLRQVAPTNLTNVQKHAAREFALGGMSPDDFKRIAEGCINLRKIIDSVIAQNAKEAAERNENENDDADFPRLQGVANASDVKETRPYRKREKAVVSS